MALTFAARAEGETDFGRDRAARRQDDPADATAFRAMTLARLHPSRGGSVSPRVCRASSSRRAAWPRQCGMASTAGDGPARARRSGSSGRSFPGNRRRGSTGAARRARSAPSSASGNGKRRTRCGSGSTARASMRFGSSSRQCRRSTAPRVMALAFADLCVRGGERAGLLGLTRPLATRGVVDRFAEAIATDERLHGASRAALAAAASPLAPRSHGADDRRLSLRARARSRARSRASAARARSANS